MNRFKLRNFGLAIAATLLCSLLAVSAQAATVSDTDDDLTITLTISDTITEGLDAVWGTLTVAITEVDHVLNAGDEVELWVYDNDGYFSDTELWAFNFAVTSAEEAAKAVNRTFDVSWLAIGTSYDVYAEAEVDKYAAWWYQDDSAATGEINVLVEPPSAVPIPAAAWLFGSAILGLFGIARRKKA
ncbi:VPLPA-CTERM sorting domain-containing protein [Halioglobus sp. Uisw_031]|uniref:VPLPA-CTERM sorting domain-containing protein n=1 Tax=Halioglobus sp. Uisw_031 TaxID=3230977 RepID=UPI0039ED62DD